MKAASAVFLALLVSCPVANAATLGRESGTTPGSTLLRYAADPGEQNRLVVTEGAATVTFHDAGATIRPGDCQAADTATVVCAKADLGATVFLELDVGDGDDTVRVDLARGGPFQHDDVPWYTVVKMRGGAGDDELVGSDIGSEYVSDDELDGGEGDDRLLARGGNDYLDGGPGGDLMDSGAGVDTLAGHGHDSDTAADADVFRGGGGGDQVSYEGTSLNGRTWPDSYVPESRDLRVTGDGEANDGAPGEHDNVGPGISRVWLGSGDDYFETGGSLGSAHGSAGDDEMRAGASEWVDLQADAGNDVVIGGDRGDLLIGGEGADRIVGGAGPDSVTGDEGDDWIDTRDPPATGWQAERDRHDWVTCDAGQDEIYPDQSEIRTMAPWDGCELVHPPPPPPPTEPGGLSSLGASGVLSGTKIRVRIGCPAEASSCRGRLTLTLPGAGGKIVARGNVAGVAGGSKQVSVPLTRAGRKLLRRASRLRTRGSLTPAVTGADAVKRRVLVKRRRR